MSPLKWKIFGGIALTLVLWFIGSVIVRSYRATVAGAKAAAAHVIESKNATDGAKHESDALLEHKQTALADAKAAPLLLTISQLKQDVQGLRKANAQWAASAVAPGDPAGPVQAPVDLAPLVAKLTSLTDAQDAQHQVDLARIAGRDKELADQVAATTSWKAAALASQVETTQLRLQASLKARLWTVGGLYGTNKTVGGFAQRALGPVSLGVQVVRRQLDGGQTTLEAIGTAGISF